jgi:HK97 family phage portal protein
MRTLIAHSLARLARWLEPKAAIATGTYASSYSDSPMGFLDAYRKQRLPTHGDLLAELKNTAWTCASINSAVCAANPPHLYVQTRAGDPRPKCRTKALPWGHPLAVSRKSQGAVEEVLDHPLLNLLDQVNPMHNSFDLFELTQLYMEIIGSSYWLIERNGLAGLPSAIWVLPSQNIRPVREPNSPQVVDYYEFRTGTKIEKYAPEDVIAFRLPDPRDPYRSGLSPLKACFEQVALTSQYTAMKRAIYENTGIPSVVLSPGETVGEDERQRLETEWNMKFRRGGQGRALVTDSAFKVNVLSHSMGDLAALAEAKATKEDIANAFHVPVPYLSGETNLANMEAAEVFHTRLAITPRLRRRDEKINEQLLPMYDTTGRLFVASEDPTPMSKTHLLRQQELDIRLGIKSINEVRRERGLPPVPWGDRPLNAGSDALLNPNTPAGKLDAAQSEAQTNG